MHIRSFLFLLLVSAISGSSTWRELKVVAVNKHGAFIDEIQQSLESALKWIEKAVLVQDSEVTYHHRYITANMNGYKTSDDVKDVTIQTPNKLFSVDFTSSDFMDIFNAADVVVFINEMECKDPKKEKPDASGGQVLLSGKFTNFVQKLGTMGFCYVPYKSTFNYFDLFRHELLHVLGYGTLLRNIDGVNVPGKPDEQYQWKFEDNSVQPAKRRFLNTKAIDEVKKHFNCDQLDGIESDALQHHLNEYIFFNELMTPTLGKENFFSYISAEILENVHVGEREWYKVNRTFIAPEADAYSYGKGFGCTFLKKSCYEFLDERKGTKGERPIPFCPDDSVHKCFNLGNGEIPVFSCKYIRYEGQTADNGILPTRESSKYNNAQMRYCPIFTVYYEMEKYPLIDCVFKKVPVV